MVEIFYIGIDVGTSSVRGALVDQNGNVLQTDVKNVSISSPNTDYYEQSSEEIWSSCCQVIKSITKNISIEQVRGIGFDATCSLVVLDVDFRPLPVSSNGENGNNIIMWLDHRAGEQAKKINSTKHEVLRYVGGKVSLEMQSPKILWLKQNLPEVWCRAAHFLDLPDFLTWKATGCLSRSICSLTCKWTYVPGAGWSPDFWPKIGLGELAEDNFGKIGNEIKQIGESVGSGISAKASKETGLNQGTAVAVSVIDAHCGGIGVIGCSLATSVLNIGSGDLTKRIALICGTSSCHMALSNQAIHVPGVWGPYQGAMIPGYWLNEGGQSSVANLVDHIVESHPAHDELNKLASEKGIHKNVCLNILLGEMRAEMHHSHVDAMASDIHVWPDFHGNRSPLADPEMKGMVHGLNLDKSLRSLALLYLATVQSLALGTKHILDAMTRSGHSFEVVLMTGGLQKNDLFVQTHANVTGLPIVLAKEEESVLLGGAILAACASGNESFETATKKMCRVGKVFQPVSELSRFYANKYSVFLEMSEHQRRCRDIMQSAV